MEKMIATKFVKWDVRALETLKDSKFYVLKEKLMRGDALTRDEKDWLARELTTSSYGRTCIALQGWLFSFYDYMQRYVAKYYDTWYEYYAPDKTSLRRALGSGVKEIYEIEKRK